MYMKKLKSSTYRLTTAAILTLLLALAGGCIKDDIPYPRIQPNFTEFSVEGETKTATIDSATRMVTLYLDQTVDIYSVKVKSWAITEGATIVGDGVGQTLDLSTPNYFDLKLYQEYWWTVKAQQTIDYYLTVDGQIGASVIDIPGRRVVVTLPSSANLSKVRILTAKLGSPDATYAPALAGQTVDLRHPLKVTVTDFERPMEWTIYVQVAESTVTTVRADAWTNVAWVYGEGEAGKDFAIEYREAGSDQWTTAPQEWITVDGGKFHARLAHLKSLTKYAARAKSGDETANEVEFTTGIAEEIPNADFDNWWLDGKVWCPWAEGGTKYWDTGNKGATTLGSSNTVPTDDTPSGSGKAAMLETRFVGIGIVGKLAAGNIFAGEYVKTDGTNGILSFGRPFKERPTKLRGYYKYHTAPISSTTAGFHDLKNRPDTCIIWTALIDSEEPFEIRTNPNNRHLFDPDGAEVIAYGKHEIGSDVTDWSRFEFELDYKATDRVPRYILIVASASKYGDYFTGGNGSVLYIDDLELLYDY